MPKTPGTQERESRNMHPALGVGPLKDGAGHLVSDNKVMAGMLNGYFSSVFTTEMDEPPESRIW